MALEEVKADRLTLQLANLRVLGSIRTGLMVLRQLPENSQALLRWLLRFTKIKIVTAQPRAASFEHLSNG